MHHITDLRSVSPALAKGLLALRERIAAARIPPTRLDQSFTLATWNIREFGRKTRSQAAIHYIAEVLGQFDLVSVVELREDLRDLKRVLQILGPYWRAIYSDALLDAGGNRERLAYVFDSRALQFDGLASAAFAPRRRQGNEWVSELSWWRPPYIASFSAGNFDFVVITAHVRWGDSEAGRLPELRGLAQWVGERNSLVQKGRPGWSEPDIFVLGDFNIPSRKSPLYAAITETGLRLPAALLKDEFGSNLERNKRYDQILHLPGYPENFAGRGGVLDFYDGDHRDLFPRLDKAAFTFQMSDHLPLWIEVNTDVQQRRLESVLAGRGGS